MTVLLCVTTGGIGATLPSISMSTFEAPMDAAARAAAAAARIPEPPPQPKREKAKKVCWTGDEKLVLVRWFRQVRPRCACAAVDSL